MIIDAAEIASLQTGDDDFMCQDNDSSSAAMLGFSGEAAMATNAKGVSRVRRSIILTIKSVVPLVEVAALGYVAFAVVEEIRPLLKASTKYALESEMSEAINTTAMPNPMPIEGGAAAAVPIRTAFTTRDNSDLPDR